LFDNASLNRTAFEKCNLRDARFDNCRIRSVLVEGKLLEGRAEIRDWFGDQTGRVEPPTDPCPTALQFQHLFGKFITPLGEARRDDLARNPLRAGKRFDGAASIDECIEE